jgi:glycosyltransferase involved in cell wall biosynthesis
VETVDILEAPSCEEVLDPGRPTLGFIASDNGHNIEGLRLFVEHHWERVRDQVPDSQLILAGSVCDAPGVRDIPGAVSMGRVDELFNFYASVAAVINPCPSGSGLKMKSVEALAFGKPLVTTEEGAVGLESFAAPALFIKEIGSPGYTEACVELLLDERKRRLAGEAGLRAIQTRAQQSLIRLANAVGIDGPLSLSVSDGSTCRI